jgi:hypothetical protein
MRRTDLPGEMLGLSTGVPADREEFVTPPLRPVTEGAFT